MATDTSYIYGLVDPRDNEIKYVGRTIDPDYRLDTHVRMADTGKLKTMWLLELKAFNLEPQMKILETVPRADEQNAERRWVQYFQKIGKPLLNGWNTNVVIDKRDFVNGNFTAALSENRIEQIAEFVKLLAAIEPIEMNTKGVVSKTWLFGRLLYFALLGIRRYKKKANS